MDTSTTKAISALLVELLIEEEGTLGEAKAIINKAINTPAIKYYST